MEPCIHKRVLLTTMKSRLLQACKTLETISARLNLWIHSVFHTQVLDVQDASSGSLEPVSEQSLTRQELITCVQTSGAEDDLPLPLPLTEPAPHSHVQKDGNKHRDGEKSEKDFWCSSNAPEEPELCKHSPTALFWPSNTPSLPSTMWRQSVEFLDCIDEEDTHPFVDMLCDLPSVVIDTSEAENKDQDTQDTGFRVVINPPDDSWETACYTADNNRIGPQYITSLAVPPFYQFTSRLIKYEEWMALYPPPVGTVSHDQLAVMPSRTSSGPLVFSPSTFQKYVQETRNDRTNCCYVVTALQRYQLKAVAFTASLKAGLFRTRYDIPGLLENIEPQFKWIDPAEILIESFRHTPQRVTIYTSHRPCSVPHIAIHESLPNDLYVVSNNSLNSPNYCFLAVSSPNPVLWEDDYGIADDSPTDTLSSLCDASAPVTPKDFSSTLDQDLDMLFGEGAYDTQHNDYIHDQRHEEEFVVQQYSEPTDDTNFPSESKFFIPDDEENDLPPLDDWYITIANRCMPPEEAQAVAAAAAVMSLSPH